MVTSLNAHQEDTRTALQNRTHQRPPIVETALVVPPQQVESPTETVLCPRCKGKKGARACAATGYSNHCRWCRGTGRVSPELAARLQRKTTIKKRSKNAVKKTSCPTWLDYFFIGSVLLAGLSSIGFIIHSIQKNKVIVNQDNALLPPELSHKVCWLEGSREAAPLVAVSSRHTISDAHSPAILYDLPERQGFYI